MAGRSQQLDAEESQGILHLQGHAPAEGATHDQVSTEDLERRLDPSRFIRVGRGTLANVDLITKVNTMPGHDRDERTAGLQNVRRIKWQDHTPPSFVAFMAAGLVVMVY